MYLSPSTFRKSGAKTIFKKGGAKYKVYAVKKSGAKTIFKKGGAKYKVRR